MRLRWGPTALILALCAMTVLAGCDTRAQSILDPRSPEAREIANLWWVMFAVCSVVFVAVIWFLLQAVFGREGSRPPGGPIRFVVAGGIILPAVVLVGFLIYSLRVSLLLSPPEEGLTIEVDGHQWWWEVRYPEAGIVTANEIHIPAGQRVRFRLSAHDVIHSFWVPNLHGKLDMFPGTTTTLWLQAEEPGVWRGQCAEFCGTQHALMAFTVVAHEPADFDRWIAARQEAAVAGRDRLAQGRELFSRHGCATCHAISGTEAVGTIGPDLTHLANRRTLAAATLPNTRENLAAWIAPDLNPRNSKQSWTTS